MALVEGHYRWVHGFSCVHMCWQGRPKKFSLEGAGRRFNGLLLVHLQ